MEVCPHCKKKIEPLKGAGEVVLFLGMLFGVIGGLVGYIAGKGWI